MKIKHKIENGNLIHRIVDEDNLFLFEETDKDFYEAEMEVFSAGTHNGDKYKNKDLDEMIEAFNTLKNKWKPTLKIGHGKQLGEQPALGYVDKLKRVGSVLIAKVISIPKLVKQAIEKGLYKKRSAEIYWDYKDGNKTWPRCLKAIALLGESIPAVASLKDIEKFFDEGEGEVKIYETDFDVELGAKSDKDKEVKNYMYWSEGQELIKAQVKSMDLFEFETLNKERFKDKNGVFLITGALIDSPEDRSIIQSWIFDRNIWTIKEAREWISGWGDSPMVYSSYVKIKIEDGIEFPKEAYLYTPDEEKSSTWKLRIWEDLDKKVTRAQLGRVTSTFSPDGFRGQKVELPTSDVKQVKDKLKSEYRKLGVKDNEMPKYLSENKEAKIMEWEEKLAEAQAKIDELNLKIVAYEAEKKTEKAAELQEQLEIKTKELTEMKAFKEEADTWKRERDEAVIKVMTIENERRNDNILNFVKSCGVSGTKNILPRDEKLVVDILTACPQEKKYKLDGDKNVSLEEMVKTFISGLSAVVDIGQHSKADGTQEFDTADKELGAKITVYQNDHPEATYTQAFEAVLKIDADLKERYHKEKM